MAESETGLQTNLDMLKAYCDLNQLSVYVSKTKVMVFTRSKSRLRNLANFKFGELCLERVNEYVYLGIIFNHNGSFIKTIKTLQSKSYKAIYGRRLNLPCYIMLYLFDRCVVPILLYGCEVWGCEKSVTMIELIHTKFCKFVFKVSKFTHNMMMNGELGRYPLSVMIKKRMVNYWTNILKSPGNKLNRVMYAIVYDLHNRFVHINVD